MFELYVNLKSGISLHLKNFRRIDYYGDNVIGTWQDIMCQFFLDSYDDFVSPDTPYVFVDKQDHYIIVEVPKSLIHSIYLFDSSNESWCE